MAYNEKDPLGFEHLQELRNKVFIEPTSVESRSDLIEYLKYYYEWIVSIPQSELLNGVGGTIASNLLSALSWQTIADKDGVGWINSEDEPILYEITNLCSSLDNVTDDPTTWKLLKDKLSHIS